MKNNNVSANNVRQKKKKDAVKIVLNIVILLLVIVLVAVNKKVVEEYDFENSYSKRINQVDDFIYYLYAEDYAKLYQLAKENEARKGTIHVDTDELEALGYYYDATYKYYMYEESGNMEKAQYYEKIMKDEYSKLSMQYLINAANEINEQFEKEIKRK